MKVLIVLAALCSLAYGGAVFEPWQVEMKAYTITICIGVAINPTASLTVANSLQGIPADAVTLSDSQGAVYQAQSYKVHPEYDPLTGKHNVALVKTLPMNSYVLPLPLATTMPENGQSAIAYSLNPVNLLTPHSVNIILSAACGNLNVDQICATYSGLDPFSKRILVSDQKLYGIGSPNILGILLGNPEPYTSIIYYTTWINQ